MTKSQSLLSLTAGLALGHFLGGGVGPNVTAQVTPSAPATARYQISAWAYAGNPSSPTPRHGYYVVDTMTGAIWESDTNDKPIRVSGTLP